MREILVGRIGGGGRFGDMVNVNGIPESDGAGLNVRGGEFTQFFTGGADVSGPVVGSPGGQDLASGAFPIAITLDQDEALVRWNGGDSANQGWGFSLGFFRRFFHRFGLRGAAG